MFEEYVRKSLRKKQRIHNFLWWKGCHVFPCQFLAIKASDSPPGRRSPKISSSVEGEGAVKIWWWAVARTLRSASAFLQGRGDLDAFKRCKVESFRGRNCTCWICPGTWEGCQEGWIQTSNCLNIAAKLARATVFWLFREEQALFEDRSYWNRSFLCFWGSIVNFLCQTLKLRELSVFFSIALWISA